MTDMADLIARLDVTAADLRRPLGRGIADAIPALRDAFHLVADLLREAREALVAGSR